MEALVLGAFFMVVIIAAALIANGIVTLRNMRDGN